MQAMALTISTRAGMTELADVSDLKSEGPKGPWGFDSPSRHQVHCSKRVVSPAASPAVSTHARALTQLLAHSLR